MEVDEFVKRVRPASRKSKLTAWNDSIQKLLGLGYEQGQVLEFLKENGVVVARSTLSAFLDRQARTREKEQRPATTKQAPPRVASSHRQQATLEREVPELPDDEPPSGSHNPADLDKIINQKPDLAALAKLAKRKPK
jgi:hypothetical protein